MKYTENITFYTFPSTVIGSRDRRKTIYGLYCVFSLTVMDLYV